MINPTASQGQGNSQAGHCNTRLNSQIVSLIDYITFSGGCTHLKDLKEFFRYLALKICPEPVDDWTTFSKSKNFKVQCDQYRSHRTNLHKARLIHSQKIDTAININHHRFFPASPVKQYPARFESILVAISGGCSVVPGTEYLEDYTIQLSGQFWGQLSLSDQIEVLCTIAQLPSVKVSRIDLSIDDFSKEIIPYDLMVEACDADQFSGFRDGVQLKNFSLKKGDRKGTLNMGSRQSKSFHRCYWKPDRLRFEHEIKGKESNLVFQSIVAMSGQKLSEIADYLAKLSIGSIQFVDRTKSIKNGKKEKNLDRCEPLSWWQEFLDIVGSGIRIKLPVIERSLEKTKKWFERQIYPTLFAFREGMGILDFNTMIDTGLRSVSQRQSKHHEQVTDLLLIDRLSRQGWDKVA